MATGAGAGGVCRFSEAGGGDEYELAMKSVT